MRNQNLINSIVDFKLFLLNLYKVNYYLKGIRIFVQEEVRHRIKDMVVKLPFKLQILAKNINLTPTHRLGKSSAE